MLVYKRKPAIGRMTGIEPANNGTTTHCLNPLATLALLHNNNAEKKKSK